MRARRIQRFPAGPSPWPILRVIVNMIDWRQGLPHLGTPMPPIQNAALSLRKDLACVTHFKRTAQTVLRCILSGNQVSKRITSQGRAFVALMYWLP